MLSRILSFKSLIIALNYSMNTSSAALPIKKDFKQ